MQEGGGAVQSGEEQTVGVGQGTDISRLLIMKLFYLLNHVALDEDRDV